MPLIKKNLISIIVAVDCGDRKGSKFNTNQVHHYLSDHAGPQES